MTRYIGAEDEQYITFEEPLSRQDWHRRMKHEEQLALALTELYKKFQDFRIKYPQATEEEQFRAAMYWSEKNDFPWRDDYYQIGREEAYAEIESLLKTQERARVLLNKDVSAFFKVLRSNDVDPLLDN